MNYQEALAIKRKNFDQIKKIYHNNTVDGAVYQSVLYTYGRTMAEAMRAEKELDLYRAALAAQMDIYGNPLENQVPIVTGVAVAVRDTMYSLPAPFRHHHIVQSDRYYEALRKSETEPGEQGFVVNGTFFASRKQAMEIARAANQLLDRSRLANELYSEEVWAHWDNDGGVEAMKRLRVTDLFLLPIRN